MPDLDVDQRLAQLDRMAGQVSEPTLNGVCRLLFRDLGFHGNTDDYYDPANSFLDVVLDRRVGNPITLSVLTLSISRRCGAPLDPVGMPGHFLLRDRVDTGVYIDAFDGGTQLDEAGCRALFRRLAGPQASFAPEFLLPTPAPLVLARILNNLIASFRSRDDRDAVGWAALLRSHITDAPEAGLADLADQLGRSGRWDTAGAILHNLAQGQDTDEQRDALELRSLGWLAKLN